MFKPATGTAAATGTIQAVTSTLVYAQALLPVGLELRARRLGDASILDSRLPTERPVASRAQPRRRAKVGHDAAPA